MHLLVIQETDWQRRGPHQQHHLLERLSLRGHSVIVLDYPILRQHWPQEPPIVPRLEVGNAARIYPGASIRLITPGTLSPKLLGRPSSVLSHAIEGMRQVRRQRPDVILSYALSTGIPALMLAQREGIPYVFHVIDALHAIVPDRVLQPIAHTVERWMFSRARETVLINDHLRDYAVAMGAAPERARVLRTGVDLDRFHPDNDGAELRARWGIAPAELVLFFMGWIYSFSGVHQVAETLVHAPAGVRLLVAGDGDQYEALQRLRDERLGERLILTGRVGYDQIPGLLAAADVALLPFERVPATEYIVPIKLYEYMAAGKPVISTPLPGVRRDVGDKNGVLYAEAVDQIELALSIRSSAREIGAAGRAFVKAHCDWAQMTDEFEALLYDVTSNE